MSIETEKVTLADGRERVRVTDEDGRKFYWWHSRHRAREITSARQRALIDAAIACSARPTDRPLPLQEKDMQAGQVIAECRSANGHYDVQLLWLARAARQVMYTDLATGDVRLTSQLTEREGERCFADFRDGVMR